MHSNLNDVDDVENLSTSPVDKFDDNIRSVDNVENLSTSPVDNSITTHMMWIMWKTYPQVMWISMMTTYEMWIMWKTYPQVMWISIMTTYEMWTMWKTYPHRVWITNINLLLVDSVENLSTLPVDKC